MIRKCLSVVLLPVALANAANAAVVNIDFNGSRADDAGINAGTYVGPGAAGGGSTFNGVAVQSYTGTPGVGGGGNNDAIIMSANSLRNDANVATGVNLVSTTVGGDHNGSDPLFGDYFFTPRDAFITLSGFAGGSAASVYVTVGGLQNATASTNSPNAVVSSNTVITEAGGTYTGVTTGGFTFIGNGADPAVSPVLAAPFHDGRTVKYTGFASAAGNIFINLRDGVSVIDGLTVDANLPNTLLAPGTATSTDTAVGGLDADVNGLNQGQVAIIPGSAGLVGHVDATGLSDAPVYVLLDFNGGTDSQLVASYLNTISGGAFTASYAGDDASGALAAYQSSHPYDVLLTYASNPAVGGSFQFDYNFSGAPFSTDGVTSLDFVGIAVVPEPASIALIGFGALGLLARRRQR